MNLDRFPKTQPSLPDAYKKIYVEHYRNNRNQASTASKASGFMEGWMHKQVAQAKVASIREAILEIGAGNLNHLQFEKDYAAYDVIEPFQELYKDSPFLKSVDTIYNSISDVSGEKKYDRILSVAVLEHLCELPTIVAQSCLKLKPEGVFVAGIPSEGHFLWKLGYTCTTGVEFRLKYGLDYSVLMNYEHVNTAEEIGDVLEYFFKDTRRKLFGVSKALSLYQVWTCSQPDIQKAKAYLEKVSR